MGETRKKKAVVFLTEGGQVMGRKWREEHNLPSLMKKWLWRKWTLFRLRYGKKWVKK